MIKFRLLIISFLILASPLYSLAADSFRYVKLSEGIFAGIAKPGGKAQTNILIVIGKSQVTLAGAHFVPDIINEISRDVSGFTPLPIRSVILTHHHKGFSFVDFDFPRSFELLMTWQTRKHLKGELRAVKNSIYFFEKGLSIERDGTVMTLLPTDKGHTSGDLMVYFPDKGILFTSDLLFNDVVGYMGDGFMKEWIELLDNIEEIGATTIVPGLGDVSNSGSINRFRTFFKEFLTEVIRLKSEGITLKDVQRKFRISELYSSMPGYKTFINTNIERAFNDPDVR